MNERITQGSTVTLNPTHLFEIREKFIGDHYNQFLRKIPEKDFKKELTFLCYERPHFDDKEKKHYDLCRVRGLVVPDPQRNFDISELLIPVDCLTIIKQQYQHDRK